ncbi:MAG: DUF3801 domain-containing protein, partial [Eubacteriales bacterium]|nr:DUF3801 domain-containing protein [Eubacteriales bacterium]
MQTGGEAADQVVKMSLEGAEFAIRIAGEGATRIMAILVSVLREESKTRGKARLNSMLRSGKELKVFTVKNSDLKKFTQEAKKYGVLYNVLADRKTQDPNVPVDIIARAEDAAKISRIMERFHLSSVNVASVVAEAEKSRDNRATEQAAAQPEQVETQAEQQKQQDKEDLLNALFGEPKQEETEAPFLKTTQNDPLSAPSSANPRDSTADEGTKRKVRKPSVRAELREIKAQRKQQEESKPPVPEPNRKQQNQQPITHQQPVRKP